MTEQEWLDNVAYQLPERDMEWVLDLARICSTDWAGSKPPTAAAGEPSGASAVPHVDKDSQQGP